MSVRKWQFKTSRGTRYISKPARFLLPCSLKRWTRHAAGPLVPKVGIMPNGGHARCRFGDICQWSRQSRHACGPSCGGRNLTFRTGCQALIWCLWPSRTNWLCGTENHCTLRAWSMLNEVITAIRYPTWCVASRRHAACEIGIDKTVEIAVWLPEGNKILVVYHRLINESSVVKRVDWPDVELICDGIAPWLQMQCHGDRGRNNCNVLLPIESYWKLEH